MGHDVPDTSKSAYKQAQKGMIDNHKQKIIAAFEKLGESTADQIAQYLGMDHSQVNRRFVELSRDDKIINTNRKKQTRSGRDAYIWTLNVAGAKTDNEAKEGNIYKKGQKTSTDFSKELIEATKQSTLF